MDRIIPENLDELRKANSKPNPVNIAGYGQESTHKGYLSWILDSDRNPKAIELATFLLQKAAGNWRVPFLGSAGNPLNIQRVWVTTETQLGKKFIDIMIHLDAKGEEFTNYALGVVIKTDSGPSSPEQFDSMYAELEDNPQCLGAIVLQLGTSCLFRGDLVFGFFEPVSFVDIYKMWNEQVFAGTQLSLDSQSKKSLGTPRFLIDWMEAIGMEIARKNLSHEAYLESQAVTSFSHADLGYRLARHPIMYAYPIIQSALESNRNNWYWITENSTKNSALGCGFKGIGHFVPVSDVQGISWFYEFNDDCFHLKIKNESQDDERLRTWINSTKQKITAIDLPPMLKFAKTRVKLGRWMTVAKWIVDWKDIHKAAKDLVILTERLESNIVGKPIKQGGA